VLEKSFNSWRAFLMAFDQGVPFPLELSALTPKSGWSTTVVMMTGGSEQRNANFSDARRTYDASTAATLTLAELQSIQKHFNARRGRARSFALRDRSAFRAATDLFGTGDGVTTTFQLSVVSGDSANAYGREIYVPETGTVSIFDNGSPVSPTITYTGANGGRVVFAVAPTAGHLLTWSGDYWIPVRYDIDEFPDSKLFIWTTGTAGLAEGPSIPMIEVRYTDEF
jgi:uncharacterized protein (TIGR02217 family)